MAVADASLRTVNVSISFGLIVLNILETPLIPSLSIGRPSITIRGLLLADKEEPPRTRIVTSPPGAPPSDVTFTPAIFPVIISVAVVVRPRFSLSGLIAVTDPVRSFFFTVP